MSNLQSTYQNYKTILIKIINLIKDKNVISRSIYFTYFVLNSNIYTGENIINLKFTKNISFIY